MSNGLSPGFGGQAAPLPPKANPLGAGGPPDPGASPMMQHLGDKLGGAVSQYQKMQEAKTQVSATRKELDKLATLGDTVSPDDVIKAASGMVAAGIPAAQVAGLLADMPEGGPALQSWIAEQDQAVQQREAQVTAALAVTQHNMAVAGIRHLLGHSAEAEPQAEAAPESSEPSMNLEPSNAG